MKRLIKLIKMINNEVKACINEMWDVAVVWIIVVMIVVGFCALVSSIR